MQEANTTVTEIEPVKEKIRQLVGFGIGKEMFGVDILTVQEIIRSAQVIPVPNSPDFIEGIINLRGSIIPVIELRKRLNLIKREGKTNKAELEETWILILDIDGRITGFIVDKVTEVLKIAERTIELPPDLVVAGLKRHYIQGVCKIDADLLILLDFGNILKVEDIKMLKKVKSA